MEHDDLARMRKQHPAWRLLCAHNAPLILSFLGRVFVEENVRRIGEAELVSRLDDELYALNEQGVTDYPKTAKQYLTDWAADEAGWLRTFYPEGSDEPHYDITQHVETAISWIESLKERSFVGTESRLNTVFDLLRQIVQGSETDPEVRLVELQKQRHDLDEEIARVAMGQFDLLDDIALRDRYQQLAATARELLSDFRQVEANFRGLDRRLRERISAWDGPKGTLLDDVLGNRDDIAESDQGRSFQAFYDFLLSYAKQQEFTDMIAKLDDLAAIDVDPRIRRIHHDWLDAAERTQDTVRQLSEQLRRFLDDQVWFENRRVMEILRSIEKRALRLRDNECVVTTELDDSRVDVKLAFERPLYKPRKSVPLNSDGVEVAASQDAADTLFEQIYVDRDRLLARIAERLRTRTQIDLWEVVDAEPLEHGLAELVAYLSISDPSVTVVFDEERRCRIGWRDPAGVERTADLPVVTYVRTDLSPGAR